MDAIYQVEIHCCTSFHRGTMQTGRCSCRMHNKHKHAHLSAGYWLSLSVSSSRAINSTWKGHSGLVSSSDDLPQIPYVHHNCTRQENVFLTKRLFSSRKGLSHLRGENFSGTPCPLVRSHIPVS